MNIKLRGFTLVELMITVSILSILAVGSFAVFRNAFTNSRDMKRKADLEVIQAALETYYADFKAYPADLPACNLPLEGSPIPALPRKTYLKKMPCDPKDPNNITALIKNPEELVYRLAGNIPELFRLKTAHSYPIEIDACTPANVNFKCLPSCISGYRPTTPTLSCIPEEDVCCEPDPTYKTQVKEAHYVYSRNGDHEFILGARTEDNTGTNTCTVNLGCGVANDSDNTLLACNYCLSNK